MLPQPNANFILPSLYDGTELKCRLYFPKGRRHSTSDATSLNAAGLAIFAHPYAPLGGSYDDPVVHLVGQQLLTENFLLITFNFRGAEGSEGSTSWSAKPELADYVSVYVFALAFINDDSVLSHLATSRPHNSAIQQPSLLLGGYSYGSMITAHLPDVNVPVRILEKAEPASAEHEIKVRAQELAGSFTRHLEKQQFRGLPGTRNGDEPISGGGTYGGHESARKDSHDSKRPIHLNIRGSVDSVRRKLSKGSHNPEQKDTDVAAPRHNIVLPRLSYLLISPLLGPVSSLAVAFSTLRFERHDRKATAARDAPSTDVQLALSSVPSLVVYGSHDQFTSSKKVRKWCQTLATQVDSKFEFKEIADAGHFWFEQDNAYQLQVAVSSWLEKLD